MTTNMACSASVSGESLASQAAVQAAELQLYRAKIGELEALVAKLKHDIDSPQACEPCYVTT